MPLNVSVTVNATEMTLDQIAAILASVRESLAPPPLVLDAPSPQDLVLVIDAPSPQAAVPAPEPAPIRRRRTTAQVPVLDPTPAPAAAEPATASPALPAPTVVETLQATPAPATTTNIPVQATSAPATTTNIPAPAAPATVAPATPDYAAMRDQAARLLLETTRNKGLQPVREMLAEFGVPKMGNLPNDRLVEFMSRLESL